MPLADTLRRLPPAAVDYAQSLFDHHWFEASWLYERRATLKSQGALLSADGWLELEARGEAHVKALAKGGDLVLDECEAKAIDGDVGELNTAIRLLTRAEHPERIDAMLDRIEWLDPERARAVAEALTWDAPDTWAALVAGMLADESTPDDALGTLARVAASRGWPVEQALLGVLEDRVGDLEAVAWALGVLGVGEALPELYALIEEDQPPSVRQAAALAALRFAPGEVLAFLEQVVAQQPWAAIPLAIGGRSRTLTALEGAVETSPSTELMWALGLLGCAGGIARLLDWVEDEAHGSAAAEGLHLLTGADLFEERYEPNPEVEPTDEDEESPGLLVRRLPCSRAIWEAWLHEHAPQLPSRTGTRLRGGQPWEPLGSLEELGRTNLGGQVRRWLLEELDVRYRLEVGAWPWLLQRTQRERLSRARAEVQARPKLVAGEWYLAGQPLRV